MQKKHKKIWSIQKKAVLLHPLLKARGRNAPFRRKQIAEACNKPFWAEAASPVNRETAPGAIAQLVEQRTENPCVPSSILGGTTKKRLNGLFFGARVPESN